MSNSDELMLIANDFANDYGVEGLLEELFPYMTVGELIAEMYDAGLIPTDVLERFLIENDE